MSLELYTIDRKPREVAAKLQRTVLVHAGGPVPLEAFTRKLDAARASLEAQGLPILRLTLSCVDTDEDTTEARAYLTGSRLETAEETAARVARLEVFNSKKLKEERERVERLRMRSEYERILGGLSLEQLRAMPKVNP